MAGTLDLFFHLLKENSWLQTLSSVVFPCIWVRLHAISADKMSTDIAPWNRRNWPFM